MSTFKLYNRLRNWAKAHEEAGYPLFELKLLVADIRRQRLELNTNGRDPPGYDKVEEIFIAWSDMKGDAASLLRQLEKLLLEPIFFELLAVVF